MQKIATRLKTTHTKPGRFIKSIKAALLSIFLLGTCFMTGGPALCEEAPRIAKWRRNYEGAVSLRFDDTLESHRSTAIPLLNRHDIKATFMVNPGNGRYRDHRAFWEQQVPGMGHHLGNHTMNHRGARDLQEAEYEIGEAARTIRSIAPRSSGLLVFASGGGKTWGGRDWIKAEPAYHQLAEKYKLIDLYDGKHPAVGVNAKSRIAELCDGLDRTAGARKHQAFVFHHIGKPSLMDSIKTLVRGNDITTREETFSAFLQCISERKDRLWTAPLLDVLKYEEEARGAALKVLRSDRSVYSLSLSVQTDPALYDQQLTVVLPVRTGKSIRRIMQDSEELHAYQRVKGESLVDVRPKNSTIHVQFN